MGTKIRYVNSFSENHPFLSGMITGLFGLAAAYVLHKEFSIPKRLSISVSDKLDESNLPDSGTRISLDNLLNQPITASLSNEGDLIFHLQEGTLTYRKDTKEIILSGFENTDINIEGNGFSLYNTALDRVDRFDHYVGEYYIGQ